MHCNIVNFIQLLITNEDVTKPKPDPEGYITAMVTLGCSPAETVIVEDSYKGQQAATSSGAYLIKVNNASDVTLQLLHNHMNNYILFRRFYNVK